MPTQLNDRLLVTAIQHMTIDDGEGLRTTVFLKGCPLRCPWCCNPETHSQNIDYYLSEDICQQYRGSNFCGDCKGLLDNSEQCPFGAREVVGAWMSTNEIISSIQRAGYRGVTFSGGEPLLQITTLLPLIQRLKSDGYNIAIETALSVQPNEELLACVDQWIVDLKLQKPFYYFKPKKTMPNTKFRLVVFSELLKEPKWLPWLSQQLKMLCVDEIELLGYHELGKSKYKKLGLSCQSFTSPSEADINLIKEYIHKEGIRAQHLTI